MFYSANVITRMIISVHSSVGEYSQLLKRFRFFSLASGSIRHINYNGSFPNFQRSIVLERSENNYVLPG